MSTPFGAVRSLPAIPDLEQQKKQARELLAAARARDSAALERLRTHHPRLAAIPEAEWARAGFALHAAQLVIAREYGFASWPKLKSHIETTVARFRTRPLVSDRHYYEARAEGLLAVLGDGAPATIAQVRSWHPAFADASDEQIREAANAGEFTMDDARFVYAREHGFANWDRFIAHLGQLERGVVREPFRDVVEAGRRGDWQTARSILRAHPDLVRARGTNGNTLLNLASSLVACPAAEGPGEASATSSSSERLAPLRLLIAAGADVNQPNDRGWTPLHQAAYRNDVAMVSALLAAGARVDAEAHGEGGTPLAIALFWG
ncbi:MAG: ankyrin repeat domain-containing protein, partial [Gemmatimonadetes bacterium]|nr:ankyrin repeat domain-containing protein [Gemmatimonadota bacterium]